MSIRLKTSFIEQIFDHHVNIIGGLEDLGISSGTLKTYFYNRLRVANDSHTIVDGYNVIFVSELQSQVSVIVDSSTVVILDEANFRPGLIQKLYKQIEEVNAYLILIGRVDSSSIPCNFEALYYISEFTEESVKLRRFADNMF